MPSSQPSYPLLAPPEPTDVTGPYQLRARSARVARNWQDMSSRIPKAVQRCYEHLAEDPHRSIPGRIFPLRGKEFRGLWEYEVSSSERLYYLPDAQKEPEMAGWTPEEGSSASDYTRVCLVFACGGHINPPQR